MVLPIKDENPTRSRPVLTLLIIAACVYAFFAIQPPIGSAEEEQFLYEHAAIPCEVTHTEPLSVALAVQCERSNLTRLEAALALRAPGADQAVFPDKNVWMSLLASMFLHGSIAHLGGNMLFLWIFGNNIEDQFGKVGYAVLYLVTGVGATLAHVFSQPDSTIPLIGASGAIAGVMGAYLVYFPRHRILTLLPFFLVVHMPAYLVLVGWFVLQFFTNPNTGVAAMAHIGGFVLGAAIAGIVRMLSAGGRAVYP
jgi:membrane associated rhomboid family serine protease